MFVLRITESVLKHHSCDGYLAVARILAGLGLDSRRAPSSRATPSVCLIIERLLDSETFGCRETRATARTGARSNVFIRANVPRPTGRPRLAFEIRKVWRQHCPALIRGPAAIAKPDGWRRSSEDQPWISIYIALPQRAHIPAVVGRALPVHQRRAGRTIDHIVQWGLIAGVAADIGEQRD